jgi:hypothetical protein
VKNIGKPCAGKPHARFDEGGQGDTCSLLYPEFTPEFTRCRRTRSDMFLHLTEKDLDRYIYRIVSLKRLKELFKAGNNVLLKPRKWEDPFENFSLRSKVRLTSGEIIVYNFHDRFYGQCWSFHKASDAMWRIYSPKSDGIRIRTTVRQLAASLYSSLDSLPDVKCCLGKVLYLNQSRLQAYSNNIFDDDGISVENLFKSLLVKRPAFSHENEVRLLYFELDDNGYKNDVFNYKIDPHSLITQIMIDPRIDKELAYKLKKHIALTTGFNGEIKRSLLYAFPDDMVLNAKKTNLTAIQ